MPSYYSNQKLIYVRKNENVGDDDRYTDGGAYSPGDIIAMTPSTSNSAMLINLEARINQGTDYQTSNFINSDFITLATSTASNDKREVMKAIVDAVNDPAGDVLVVLGDDVTEEYIHPFVSSCGATISDQLT